MAKYICKISGGVGQTRITIPVDLVLETGLKDVEYVELIKNMNGNIVIRRLEINGKKTANGTTSTNGPG